MAKARKKKIPISTIASTSSSKPKSSRTVIRQYHVLLKQQATLQALQTRDAKTSQVLDDVNRQIDELGGLEFYQRMSAIGQGHDRGGGSEKIAIPWLKEISKPTESDGHPKPMLNLLEVGALKPDNYESCRTWIKTTPLDLHSRHPSILEQDFLLMDETEHREKWDVVSLSLVLNFVSDAKDRGRMLRLALEFPCARRSSFPCAASSLCHELAVSHLRTADRDDGCPRILSGKGTLEDGRENALCIVSKTGYRWFHGTLLEKDGIAPR